MHQLASLTLSLPRFSLDKLRKPFPTLLRNSSSSSISLYLRIKPPSSSSASSFSPSPLGGCSGNFHPPPLVLFFLPCPKSLLKFLDQKGDRGAQEESFSPVKSHHVIMMTDCSSIFCLDMRHAGICCCSKKCRHPKVSGKKQPISPLFSFFSR